MKKLSLLLAVAVTGCGGDGLSIGTTTGSTTGGTSGNASLGGVWNGSLTNGTATDNVIALITTGGSGVLIDQTSGTINRFAAVTSGDSVTGTYRGYTPSGTLYPSGSNTETGSLSGTVAPESNISGTFSSSNLSGSFAIDFNATQYDQAASFASIAGTYTYNYTTLGTSVSYTLTIDASGTITGSTDGGCTLTGNFGIPGSSFNLYTISLKEACSGSSDSFTGFATYISSGASLTLEYDDNASTAVQVTAFKP